MMWTFLFLHNTFTIGWHHDLLVCLLFTVMMHYMWPNIASSISETLSRPATIVAPWWLITLPRSPEIASATKGGGNDHLAFSGFWFFSPSSKIKVDFVQGEISRLFELLLEDLDYIVHGLQSLSICVILHHPSLVQISLLSLSHSGLSWLLSILLLNSIGNVCSCEIKPPITW